MRTYKDLSFKEEDIIFKIKKEFIDIQDKVNNKINNIIDIKKRLKKNDEVRKNIESIYEILFRLPNDPRLRRDKVNKADTIIDGTLNFVSNKISRKNKISSKKINRDNYKDSDTYVSDKLGLLERVNKLLNDIIDEIENIMNNDLYDIHLKNIKIREFMRQLKIKIKNIFS